MFLCFNFVFLFLYQGHISRKKEYAKCKSGTYFHDLFTMTCNIHLIAVRLSYKKEKRKKEKAK